MEKSNKRTNLDKKEEKSLVKETKKKKKMEKLLTIKVKIKTIEGKKIKN